MISNPNMQAPSTRILSPRGWFWLMGIFLVGAIVVPILNTLVPAEGSVLSFLHIPDRMVDIFSKYMCYAMVALAIDLIWGYTGILSLGHGFFFALGAYGMGMHMTKYMDLNNLLVNTKDKMPDIRGFMGWNTQQDYPWFWNKINVFGTDIPGTGFESFGYGLILALVVPTLIAFVFGYFAFRSRIKGVYFAIITQALTYVVWLLFLRNDTGFGGNNGLTGFKAILNFSLTNPEESKQLNLIGNSTSTKLGLYIIVFTMLCACFMFCRYIITSKLGRVLRAIRDAESRVMFSGYDTLRFKLFIWTVSALICAVAGMLYTPVVGIINPDEMKPANSIEMVVWVAVGGRGTLIGPILGSGVINGTKTLTTTGAMADYWLFILGGIAIFVTMFFRGGLVDRQSHEQVATGLARFLGSRASLLQVPVLFPIALSMFIPSVFMLLLAILAKLGIPTGVSFSDGMVSWLYFGLGALPVYLLLKFVIGMVSKRSDASFAHFVQSVKTQFDFSVMLVRIGFVGLATYTYLIAVNYPKPFGTLVLLSAMLLPVGIFIFRRDILQQFEKYLLPVIAAYVLLLVLLAIFPGLLLLHGTYIGVVALLVAMVLPFVPYFKGLLTRVSVGRILALVVLLPVLYWIFFAKSAQGAPLSIFLRINTVMFDMSGQELEALQKSASMLTATTIYFVVLCAAALACFVKPYFINRKPVMGQ